MPTRSAVTAVLLACALAGGTGCGRKAELKKLSSAKSLLALQHQTWHNARQTLHSDKPNVSQVAVVYSLLADRTRRRVRMDYTAANKQEVLARLESLRSAYLEEVMSKIDTSGAMPVLKAGATVEQVRQAFMKIDPAYRELEAMTTPGAGSK